jgi:hypothetical protein
MLLLNIYKQKYSNSLPQLIKKILNMPDYQKPIWSSIMAQKEKELEDVLSYNNDNCMLAFGDVKILKMSDLMANRTLSSCVVDPRDVLVLVERCVDERFCYKRSLPQKINDETKIKFNARTNIFDFGIPGAGCLYTDDQREIVCKKIADFLIKNEIPGFVSEGHEGCGAIATKISKNFAFTKSLAMQTAQDDANQSLNLVTKFAEAKNYKIYGASNYATMSKDCYRSAYNAYTEEEAWGQGEDNLDSLDSLVAQIHNGVGIIVNPNFFDKKPHCRIFDTDKFCLSSELNFFNIVDTGKELDNSSNSTVSYILFCINIMIGSHGLGPEYFEKHPLKIIASCDNNYSIDTLRSYQIFTEVRESLIKIGFDTKMVEMVMLEY